VLFRWVVPGRTNSGDRLIEIDQRCATTMVPTQRWLSSVPVSLPPLLHLFLLFLAADFQLRVPGHPPTWVVAAAEEVVVGEPFINTSLLRHRKVVRLSRGDKDNPSVFIAIGSAPKKDALRDTVRSTWLKACQVPVCAYRFFTDDNHTLGDQLGGPAGPDGAPADVVTTPADLSGYSNFGARALLQMEWSLRHADFDHYLRVDDDGLLCVEHLQHDLRQLPLKRLFWGKYWCQHMVRCPLASASACVFVLVTW
jgi:hypothetical protein